MKISIASAHEIDAGLRARWLALQRSNPALASPYFAPEFTQAVATVSPTVRIAILETDGRITGFFPYQSRWTIGAPVGGLLSDHHGVVCAPGTRWDWAALLRAARLSCWRFDHLCAAQVHRAPVRRARSPALDLSSGFPAYLAQRRAVHGEHMGGYARKARRLAREWGPLRLECHTRDDDVMGTLVHLKSDQCQRTGAVDVLRIPWVRALLDVIRGIDAPHFAGRLSALYAGDTLVAVQMGMRSARVWHWWLPAYDPAFARYSPGVQMVLRLAEAAAMEGHGLLDLGKGREPYKTVLADHAIPIAEGVLTWPAATASLLAQAVHAAQGLLATSPGRRLKPLIRRARGL